MSQKTDNLLNSSALIDSSALTADVSQHDLVDIKEQMKIFKYELVKEINQQTSKFEESLESYVLERKKLDEVIGQKNGKKSVEREKVFRHRESILTDLFKISHLKTIRHIFISLLMIICFQLVIYDLTHLGRVNLDFKLFYWVMDGFFGTIFFVWAPMKLTVTFTVYYVLKFYARNRKTTNKKSLLDAVFALTYFSYLTLFITIPLMKVPSLSLGCRILVLMEQVRLLMKTHAFVRSIIPRIVMNELKNTDSTQPKRDPFPELSKFVYFLFAPTLVYRDNYPRTTGPIKWKNVLVNLCEVAGCMLYTYCLFDRYCVPVFRSLRVRDLGLVRYIELVSISILPGALMQMMVFFSFLHSWHNATAELLNFGDRQFYLDWWNSTSFNEYYRTWNTLVHDWLYNYIYRDLYIIFGKKYKVFAQFGVIAISGLVHEYILSFTFGFFYPVLFVMFAGFGFAVMFIPTTNKNAGAWNIFVWTSLFTGIGIEICFFAIEWYARSSDQCPRNIHTTADYFIPRSLLCSASTD